MSCQLLVCAYAGDSLAASGECGWKKSCQWALPSLFADQASRGQMGDGITSRLGIEARQHRNAADDGNAMGFLCIVHTAYRDMKRDAPGRAVAKYTMESDPTRGAGGAADGDDFCSSFLSSLSSLFSSLLCLQPSHPIYLSSSSWLLTLLYRGTLQDCSQCGHPSIHRAQLAGHPCPPSRHLIQADIVTCTHVFPSLSLLTPHPPR